MKETVLKVSKPSSKHWLGLAATSSAALALMAAATGVHADQVEETSLTQSAPAVSQTQALDTFAAQAVPAQDSNQGLVQAPAQDAGAQLATATSEPAVQESTGHQLSEEVAAPAQAASEAAPETYQTRASVAYVYDSSIPANDFYERNGSWYYADANRQAVTGWQDINGQRLYFHQDGRQAKGQLVDTGDGTYYFDANSGDAWTNRFVQVTPYNSQAKTTGWTYLGKDGRVVTGWQDIDGKRMYFLTPGRDNTGNRSTFYGQQVKGYRQTIDGKDYYFDKDSGVLFINGTYTENGVTYYADVNGVLTLASQGPKPSTDISRQGRFEEREFTAANGSRYKGWTYIGLDGQPVTGFQTIDNKRMFFFTNGEQAKNLFLSIYGNLYYFDQDGAMVTNRTVNITRENAARYLGTNQAEYNGWIHLGADGLADSGYQRIYSTEFTLKKDESGKLAWYRNFDGAKMG